MKTLIIILIPISLIGLWYFEKHSELATSDCYYDSQSFWPLQNTTKERCQELTDERNQTYSDMDNKGESIGCSSKSEYCEANFKRYTWEQNFKKLMVPTREANTFTISANEMLKRFGTTSTNVLFEYDWIETKESKSCSSYADKKVSDLPIKCLEYFGIKK